MRAYICGFGGHVWGDGKEIHASGGVHCSVATPAGISEIWLELQHPRDKFLHARGVCHIRLEEVGSDGKRLVSAVGDGRDNAVSAAAASTECPEQVRVLIVVNREVFPSRGDHRDFYCIVDP